MWALWEQRSWPCSRLCLQHREQDPTLTKPQSVPVDEWMPPAVEAVSPMFAEALRNFRLFYTWVAFHLRRLHLGAVYLLFCFLKVSHNSGDRWLWMKDTWRRERPWDYTGAVASHTPTPGPHKLQVNSWQWPALVGLASHPPSLDLTSPISADTQNVRWVMGWQLLRA
jgi:hypothetical protein